MDIAKIQESLRKAGADCWLFYDHHHRDPIAYRVLGLPQTTMVTRRWFYVIPAQGEPARLVHRIESHHLDSLPGSKSEYSSWQELHDGIRKMLAPYKKVVMQYSPNNQIPYISLVDGGMLELVRSFGKEIVSSADLVSRFEAVLSDDQIASHFEAQKKLDVICDAAFKEIGRRVRNGGCTEYDIQKFILEAYSREGVETEDPPNCSANENSGDPHYEPTAERHKKIKEGDFILIDMWGRMKRPDSVYYDITWTGFVGKAPSDKQREVFQVVRDARNVGIETVKKAFAAGEKIQGWQVDHAVRAFIESKGYLKYFVHRTGHSITHAIHGNGANLDDLETKDDRQILPNTCFSVEPGVYLPEFGVRSEIDMMTRSNSAEVTGRIQTELVLI
ncbi:MAG TPA: Xaa-Pro peptidase family protein [Candidatus Koribacter sp.]|jgi:Xaa-Pro aminopeptidase